MGKAIGLTLIAAGLAVTAAQLPAGSDADEPPLNPMFAISSVGDFKGAAWGEATSVHPNAAIAAEPLQPPTSTVVTILHRADALTRPTMATAKALPHPSDRVTITRELQKELIRVGCYGGEINAEWTPMTRKAIKDFTDRVNASLPTHQPDNILLALVQGHQEKACGRPCPIGEGLSQDGNRCVPGAILAQAARKGLRQPFSPGASTTDPNSVPAVASWSTTITTAAPTASPVLDGRMALAGPLTDSVPPNTSPAAAPARERQPAGHNVRTHDRRPPSYAASGSSRQGGFVQSILGRNSLF